MIVLKDIDKYFDSKFQRTFVLKGIDLEVKKGEFLTIMGLGRTGKSTLLNIIILLDEPSRRENFLNEKFAKYESRILNPADGIIRRDKKKKRFQVDLTDTGN